MLAPVLTASGVAKDASYITLKDTTGAYNNPNNLGGYGAPNVLAPTKAGILIRYWGDTSNYINKVLSADALAGIIGEGFDFAFEDLGLASGNFITGVHHIKYYPFELFDSIVSLTKDSKKISVTAGTTPNQFSGAYKAVLVLNAGSEVTRVLPIDFTQPLTATEFYITETWEEESVAGYQLMLATEADLKILVTEPAEACVVARIGQLPSRKYCSDAEVQQLSDFITWKFAAEVKFQCSDFSGAHNLIVSVEKECQGCNTSCNTCS